MTEKKNTTKTSSKLSFAAALVGAAAAGYYIYGQAVQNKVKIKAWTLKAKGEVLEQFEKKRELSEEQYKEVVDKVTAKYAKLKTVGEVEATKLNKELKKHWKAIQTEVESAPVKKKK